jgi:hypothetical protein
MGNAREQVHQKCILHPFTVFILARQCANAIIGRGTPRGSGGVIVATTITPDVCASSPMLFDSVVFFVP